MSLLKNRKFWLAIVIAGIAISLAVFSYIYKPHDQIEDQKITFEGSVSELMKEASTNETSLANAIVALNGKITSVEDGGFTLDGSVFCQPNNLELISSLKKEGNISIKGRFIGYDDLLEEVKLDKVIKR